MVLLFDYYLPHHPLLYLLLKSHKKRGEILLYYNFFLYSHSFSNFFLFLKNFTYLSFLKFFTFGICEIC